MNLLPFALSEYQNIYPHLVHLFGETKIQIAGEAFNRLLERGHLDSNDHAFIVDELDRNLRITNRNKWLSKSPGSAFFLRHIVLFGLAQKIPDYGLWPRYIESLCTDLNKSRGKAITCFSHKSFEMAPSALACEMLAATIAISLDNAAVIDSKNGDGDVHFSSFGKTIALEIKCKSGNPNKPPGIESIESLVTKKSILHQLVVRFTDPLKSEHAVLEAMSVIESSYMKWDRATKHIEVPPNSYMRSIAAVSLQPHVGHIIGIYDDTESNAAWVKSRLSEANAQLGKSKRDIRCAIMVAPCDSSFIEDLDEIQAALRLPGLSGDQLTDLVLSEFVINKDVPVARYSYGRITISNVHNGVDALAPFLNAWGTHQAASFHL